MVLKSTMTVGFGTSVSRVLGLVRDVVIAHTFGAGAEADAFFVAFRVPNFLRRLFAEGAFAQAFVPVLSEYRTGRGDAATRELIAATSGALGCVLVVVTALCVLGAGGLVWVFAPGFANDPSRGPLTESMLRITFPYLLFISLTSLAAGVLNTFGRFAIPAITPVLLNVALISSALWLAPALDEPVQALAWGVFAGGVAQLALQAPFLKRIGMLVWPTLRRQHQGVRRVARLMLPALFGVSVSQINLLVDTVIASFLVSGSVSWLYYSDRLVEFPLGVFGVALATVILPDLSKKHVEGNPVGFSAALDWALRLVVLIGLPATLGIALLARPMLTTVFQYGAFDTHGIAMATESLVAYSCGLLGFIAVKVLAPGFFARQNTTTPVRIGAIAMVANIALNLALVGPLAHAGLALATSLSAFLNAGLLLGALLREGTYRPGPGWKTFSMQVLLGLGIMAVVLSLTRGEPATWEAATALGRALRLTAIVLGAAAAYGAVLWISGLRPNAFVRPQDPKHGL